MTPILSAVYDELVARAAKAPYDERSAALREDFDRRCGRFEPDHDAAGSRDAAAWEDVLVHGRLALTIADGLDDASERELAESLLGAQRGVFCFERMDGALLAHDLWSGASFVMLDKDDVARELTAKPGHDAPLCEGRMLATLDGCATLPGTIFHPADARDAIDRTLAAAREQGMSTDDALDALLRMDHKFRTYTRVKVDFAYRPDALSR